MEFQLVFIIIIIIMIISVMNNHRCSFFAFVSHNLDKRSRIHHLHAKEKIKFYPQNGRSHTNTQKKVFLRLRDYLTVFSFVVTAKPFLETNSSLNRELAIISAIRSTYSSGYACHEPKNIRTNMKI